MTNPIVIVNASVQQAAAPSQLQQTGAFISQGATSLTPGTYQVLTSASSLTAILTGAKTLSAATWSGGIVTATVSPHGFTVGDTLYLTIAGASPAGYNGTFLVTVTSSTQFTYAVANNPGSLTAPGTYTPEDVSELVAMNTTFWAQGSNVPVSVLELGPGNAADGVAFLTSWIASQAQQIFYAYLVPREWAASSAYLTMLASFESASSKTYFLTTATLGNYQTFTSLMKDVLLLVETPTTAVYPANALTAISWSGNVVTATTTTNHGVAVGDWFQIAGVTPAGYNGFFQAIAGTTGSTLMYSLASNPGSENVLGTLVGSQVASNGPATTEFSLASTFWDVLSWNPSSSNRVPPLTFVFELGVTPWPTQGNSSLLAALQSANVNYIGTGQQGGISTAILMGGRTLDGNQFNYWYAIDWLQINGNLNVANAVINGSNNPTNPLYYTQQGINTLQAVLGSTVSTGISAGLVVGSLTLVELDPVTFANNLADGDYAGQAVVNAIPFTTYVTLNPSNYQIGLYGGLQVAFTPQTGFQQIVINMTAVPLSLA